jgi:hypothetical protein
MSDDVPTTLSVMIRNIETLITEAFSFLFSDLGPLPYADPWTVQIVVADSAKEGAENHQIIGKSSPLEDLSIKGFLSFPIDWDVRP